MLLGFICASNLLVDSMECVVAFLFLLSNENDDSKYVQILETGSAKAKEDSATILGNPCNHSEDI
ncbi:hypothetical protein Hanom_Chr09g00803331 [Helianthus anomalus]